MRLAVVAVGRLRPGPEKDLAEHHLARAAQAGRQAGIAAVTALDCAESRLPEAGRRKAEEARWLRDAAARADLLVGLDETGEMLTSPAFARRLGTWLGDGRREVAFLIGGPDGLDPALRGDCALVLSLSRMTWPHRLVRVLLAEQIYRAVTILLNHPYHRD